MPQSIPPRSRLFWRRVSLAPLALCVVAGVHLVQVCRHQQSPWKGGGMGMFSTTQSEASRFLRCSAQTGQAAATSDIIPVEIPPSLATAALRVRVRPSERNLQSLATSLASSRWQSRANRLFWTDAASDTSQPTAPIQSVRVELWRSRLDVTRGELQAELMSATEASAQGNAP